MTKAYLVGGGIGSLAAAAFMIRDAGLPGENITILEMDTLLGGSLDAAGNPAAGYSMRGGRMLTTDNYECTWDLFKTIPSLSNKGQSVFEETVEFNRKYKSHSMARLVDRRRAIVPVTSMGFTMADRLQLLKLSRAEIEGVGYGYAELCSMLARYNPEQLVRGWNELPDGERIYYISNPALGLWAQRSRVNR